MLTSLKKRSTADLRIWLMLVLAVGSIGLVGGAWPDHAAASTTIADQPVLAKEASKADQSEAVPDKVFEMLGEIQRLQGNPPPGYVGGRPFQNRERRLPRGQYKEYDVNPKVSGENRGPERLVIEQRSGKAYYTKDHYRTFVKVN
jgi:ribonuclease T1